MVKVWREKQAKRTVKTGGVVSGRGKIKMRRLFGLYEKGNKKKDGGREQNSNRERKLERESHCV